MSSKAVIEKFNKIMFNMLSHIEKWYPNTDEIKEMNCLAKLFLNKSYKSLIENFYSFVYTKYKSQILSKDYKYFAEMNYNGIPEKYVNKFLIPLKKLYLESSDKQKDIIFNYIINLVRCCEIYKKLDS